MDQSLDGPEFATPELGQISVRVVNGVLYVDASILFRESIDVLVKQLEKHRALLPVANPSE